MYNYGRGFCGTFSMLFPKAPGSCGKNILKKFLLHRTSICVSSKSVSQIIKILFHFGNTDIFVICRDFLVDVFNYKAPFLTKKTSAPKCETHFSRIYAIFLVSLSSRCAHVLLGRKTELINRFLHEKYFYFMMVMQINCIN